MLGELNASLNGRSVTPTAAKPRQVLALLALSAGRIVSVPTLIEELWDDRPPMSVRTTLQTYILQLRKLIEAALSSDSPVGAKDILITRFDGYLLDIAPADVDVHVYERLVNDGNHAISEGDYETASRLLGMALDKWRGPALVDVRIGMPLSIEAARLEESRLNTLDSRIEADIRLGRHQAILSELTMLTAKHPMHENLYAHHMVSLYRAGRQSQALEVFQTLREVLNREIGVEPSARLRNIQRAILRSELDLETIRPGRTSRPAPAAVSTGPASGWERQQPLPNDSRHFPVRKEGFGWRR